MGALALAACGGSNGEGQPDGAAPSPPPTPTPAPTPPPTPAPPAPAPTPAPTPPPSLGSTFTTLAVRSASVTGVVPYTATVLPLRGHVPSGSAIYSSDDLTLRSAIVSTHDDGSAAVVIVAGETSVNANSLKTLALQAAAAGSDSPLAASRIGQLLSSVAVNFGGGFGSASIADFATPERIWWTSPRVICARYRLAAPTPGLTALEAVIDITAFPAPRDRALVEVVIENGKVNAAAVAPSTPAAASYTGASVSVNGTPIAIVNSTGPANAEGNHAALRAWYAKAWVGGDPGLRVTQTHTELQKHPLLSKLDQASTFDMSAYAADTYAPWSTGRQRASGMGAGGDHPSIGPLPQWESRALQSGDPRAWNATEVSALACLSYNINYRDSASGLVPSFSQIGTKWQGFGWPRQLNANDAAMWEVAHHPAAGLMAFIGRPSPVFIEIAQKIAVWNGTWSASDTAGWSAGTHGFWYQRRGRAWCLRSLAHATFLTPDGAAWKAPAKAAISNNVSLLDTWRTDAKAALGVTWDYAPTSLFDENGGAGFQTSVWQHWYTATEIHKLAATRLLSGTAQSALATLADWFTVAAVRWINEQPNGGWRYIPYKDTIGDSATTINSRATWALERNRAGNHTDSPSGVSGPWMSYDGVPSTYNSYSADGAAGAYYPSYFWAALVAAVERGLPGAAAAWSTVNAQITNLASWRQGFANDPRWGSTPRSS